MTGTPPLQPVETSGRPGVRSYRRLVPALAAAVVTALTASGAARARAPTP
jgi:hypothetical protein